MSSKPCSGYIRLLRPKDSIFSPFRTDIVAVCYLSHLCVRRNPKYKQIRQYTIGQIREKIVPVGKHILFRDTRTALNTTIGNRIDYLCCKRYQPHSMGLKESEEHIKMYTEWTTFKVCKVVL